MVIFHTKVGEHVFKVSCESNDLINSLKRNFHPHRTTSPDIIIELYDQYGIPFTDFDVEITHQNNKTYYQRADYRIEVDNKFSHANMNRTLGKDCITFPLIGDDKKEVSCFTLLSFLFVIESFFNSGFIS